MANVDLHTFIEDRLRALDSSIDLSAGSPAQVEFISPVLTYLGTDPFETDIDSFLTDRFRQEYPDIYASDPSAIRDAFVKPLILFLEPFKREIQLIKRNQSLQDPTMLSDQDADALAANVFDERSSGGFSTGPVRAYFTNPSNVPVEATVNFFTAGGLNFFPVSPTTMTAEQMVFNRQGALYFMDVIVKAEQAGSQYNIQPGEISGLSGLFGVVKVTNLRAFQNGSDAIDTPSFVAQARESLNERSLVTRRGANSRIRNTFQGQVRAVQVIGAGDLEMQRDLLVGGSTGHAWLTGRVLLYKNLALVQCRTVDDSVESAPQAGDVLYAYLDPATWPNVAQKARMCRLTVEEVLGPAFSGGAGFQVAFLVRWSGALPGTITPPFVVEGGFIRDGILRISSLPDIGAPLYELVVGSGAVHVFGHSDIYVRPVVQDVSTAVLTNIIDERSLIERTGLTTAGSTNVVSDLDVSFDFVVAGVKPGDILSIESGDNSGAYVVGASSSRNLYLTTTVAKPSTGARYRISRQVTIDPFDPKIPKLPFASATANDLQTTIGSNLFVFSINTIDFGVKIGDVVRVKQGLDQGDFAIVGFDAALGGRGVLVDRVAGGSEAGILYEIFTPLEKVVKPLVRIRELLLLDSAKKSTGITIPPADPVAIVPTSDFTTAQTRGRSHVQSGFVLPAFRSFMNAGNVSADIAFGNDRRYTEGIEDSQGGIWKSLKVDVTAQHELLFPLSALDSCSWFAMTVEDMALVESVPPVEVKVGDALTLLTGPNKGGYIVQEVRKFRYVDGAGHGQTLYLIQIHGAFPVDVFGDLLNFIETELLRAAQPSFLTPLKAGLDAKPYFPLFFTNFYTSLGTALRSVLTALGTASPLAATLQSAANNLLSVSYEVGVPSRGVLRSYFLQPTLFQQNTYDDASPTLYDYTSPSGEVFSFRPDPVLYPYHTLVPARGSMDVDDKDFPRDVQIGTYDGGLGLTTVTFDTVDKPTMFALGLLAEDVLALHEEVFLYGDVQLVTAVQTIQDSPRIVAAVGTPFTPDLVGDIVAIEEGDDSGTYYITGVPDSKTLILDRALTSSTPSAVVTGANTSWGTQGGKNVVSDPNIDFTNYVDFWITLFHLPASVLGNYFQGSFHIKSVISPHVAEVDLAAGSWPPLAAGALSVVTAATSVAPVSDATTTGNNAGVGTHLVGAHPIRIYQDVPTEYEVADVLSDPTDSLIHVTGQPRQGLRQPYGIRRSNLRRVNPMEMSLKQDGSLFYFDTEVVSLSSNKTANILHNTYLTPRTGTYLSQGYRHNVVDSTLSFSMMESGTIELPVHILPSFSTDRRDNELSIVGSPLQISYERSDLVEQLQTFLSSVEDRVTSANMLARHFLPSYVSYDAQYVGGSAPSVIAKDIINYVNNRSIETPIDVSDIQDLVAKRGGNLVTPTTVSIVLHDWDRKMWVEFSQDQIGGTITRVPYHGTPRVSYFVPGSDRSGQAVMPTGERINLTKL